MQMRAMVSPTVPKNTPFQTEFAMGGGVSLKLGEGPVPDVEVQDVVLVVSPIPLDGKRAVRSGDLDDQLDLLPQFGGQLRGFSICGSQRQPT